MGNKTSTIVGQYIFNKRSWRSANRIGFSLRKFFTMPIIINEIEIVVHVTPDGNGQNMMSPQLAAEAKAEIVKECIEKIMEIINQKKEN